MFSETIKSGMQKELLKTAQIVVNCDIHSERKVQGELNL